MVRRLYAVVLLLVVLMAGPGAVAAQAQQQWLEQRTDYFAILYPPEASADVARYVAFVDDVYEELAVIFNHRTPTPVTLRLFASLDAYYAVNPLAQRVSGIVAHADFRQRELVVVLPNTAGQTEQEVRNNVRHELAHLIASDLSADRLNVGFQEGVAQYVELPASELDRKVVLLQRALEEGRLLRWSDLDDRDAIYGQPEVGYPQTLSIVAFLVERDGFATLREFLTVSARSSGYRSAIERTYGVPASQLEQEWRSWLPSYVAAGYRQHALSEYDLSYIETLLARGAYVEALAELETAITWLVKADQPAVLARAYELQALASDGRLAEQFANRARDELLAADYHAAQLALAQARSLYATLGDTRQDASLAAYDELIARGLEAEARLAEAETLAQALRYPDARVAADDAAARFAQMGNTQRVNDALTFRQALDTRQAALGALALVLGCAALMLSLWQRTAQRPGPDIW